MIPEPPKKAEKDLAQRRLLYISAGPAPALQAEARVKAIGFDELTASLMKAFAPDVVVFPLLSVAQDATVVIGRLQELGFSGQCLVLCPNLPRPKLIEAELRSLGRKMKIQVLPSDTRLPDEA